MRQDCKWVTCVEHNAVHHVNWICPYCFDERKEQMEHDERDVVKPDWEKKWVSEVEAHRKSSIRLKDLEQSVQQLEQENAKLKAIAKSLSDCVNAVRFVVK